jgi:membrane-bound metal-dependent hydrolase YbcI (DUF457 family)
MYPVTHMAIAAGSVWLGAKLWRRFRGNSKALEAIDYRFAALGSQVPDLIDKPLARWGPDYFGYTGTSGHTIGHTLLFSVVLILVGIFLARRGAFRLLVLGLGSLTHPLVDPTNTYPEALFWPLLGTDFPKSTQAWRQYAQIPLDIALVTTFALLIWCSEDWRGRFKRFSLTGKFPLERRADVY